MSPSKDTILITGASGFLASHVVRTFLAHGYNVRGTVRSEHSASQVKKKHSEYASQLSTFIVPDMAAPNALDEAVKGVSGVIHTASPFILDPKDNERELLQPAIAGTLNVLTAVHRNNPSVTRVVLTASFACILDLGQGMRPGYTYTEADWNPATYEQAKESSSGSFSYCASKALAEKAAWDWMAENDPKFTLTTICPPWIFGPAIDDAPSLSHLNESLETLYNLINGSQKEVPPTDFAGFADVRDVAEAHLRGYERAEAAGQRFLIATGHFDYYAACDIIRDKFPALQDKVPRENPKERGSNEATYALDSSRSERVLGLQYRTLETTLVDAISWLLKGN